MPQTKLPTDKQAMTSLPKHAFCRRDYAVLIAQLQEAALQARRRADQSQMTAPRELVRVYSKIADAREYAANRLQKERGRASVSVLP